MYRSTLEDFTQRRNGKKFFTQRRDALFTLSRCAVAPLREKPPRAQKSET